MIVFNICVNLAIGAGRTVANVGGFLKGQRDWIGFRHVVGRSFRITLLVGLAVSIAVSLTARLLVQLFGADTPEMVGYCTDALRIFIWIVPFSMLVTLMMFIYQAMMNLTLISVPTIAFSIVEIIMLLAWPYIMPHETLWYAFPLAALLSVCTIYLISEIVRHRDSTVSRLTHIPRHAIDEDAEQYQLSIPANMEGTVKAVESVRTFIDHQRIADGLKDKLMLCLEEIFLNVYEHAGLKGRNHCYDVIIRLEQDGILSIVKDDGRPFNPLIVEKEKQGPGIKILLGICRLVDYQYMYGQNLLILQFPYE